MALGVGALGMGAFGVTGSMAQAKESELIDACGEALCTDPQYLATIDDGNSLQLAANVSLGVGAGLLALGTVLVIVGDGDPSVETGGVRLTPQVAAGPTGGNLGLGGTF